MYRNIFFSKRKRKYITFGGAENITGRSPISHFPSGKYFTATFSSRKCCNGGLMNSIAVIGGGAAGLCAAVYAAAAGAKVTLYEKNEKFARKLGITGKGRCNVTNNCTPAEFLAAVTKNNKFLYSAAYRHTTSDVCDFFEGLGVPLKTERGGRVFPVSDRAADIVNALRHAARDNGAKLVSSFEVKAVVREDDGSFIVKGNDVSHTHSAVIVCTGGVSYPVTGSTGDGYAIAASFGIPVTNITPSLVPIECAEETSSLSGLTLKNVRLSAFRGDKLLYSEMGEMLFTHFGVSGPLVLSASCHMRCPVKETRLEIDLKPAIPEDELDARLIKILTENAAKDFINATAGLLPSKLVSRVADAAGISHRAKAAEITREMRLRYLHALKHFPLTPTAFRPISEAIITSGGVDVKALNPKTMEAKSVPGLYFAGEVIDVDAYTGGYNLQIAFSTARLAAESAAEYVLSL